MNNEDVNKFLTKQLGECWHEWTEVKTGYYICNNCGQLGFICANNFFTWEGFGKLWEWSTKQEWWQGFLNKHDVSPDFRFRGFDTDLINPTNFANAIYEYPKEKADG